MPSASFPFTVTFPRWPEGLGGQKRRGLEGQGCGRGVRVAETKRDREKKRAERERETGREADRAAEIMGQNIGQELD